MGAIHFETVTKQFPGMPHPAVDRCSFDVEEGSFVVLLGPSGCGKTTLLKMVNRLVEPTEGTIYLGDTDIRQMNVNMLRRQIGYVIQQTGLFPHMTVAENVSVVPRLLRWNQERTRERVDELLTLVELPSEEYRHRYPSQMSGGQQQRVGVARALAGDPQVILMDEPFGAIDAITRAGLQNELVALQRQVRKTILFVTHDVEEAIYLADKIVVMRKGQVVQYDRPLTILTQPADNFVAELVGADDMVRHLSLIRVEAVMTAMPAHDLPADQPTVSCTDHLRHALSLLLRTGAAALTVTENGQAVGVLTLDHIRHSTRQASA